MRSNFAPRLGVRRESVFDVLERHGRRGRLVGIAHLLDPFGEDVVRSVTSVQPTGADRPLARAPRAGAWSSRRTRTCSCCSCSPPTSSATCAACATREYLDQLERDRPPRRRLPRLPRRARQARRRDRDPDGRPRPGARDRRPRPPRLGRAAGAVRRLGRGGTCRARSAGAALGAASWPRPCRRCSAWRPPRPRGAGRWCPSSTPRRASGASAGRALAVVVARDEEAAIGPRACRAARRGLRDAGRRRGGRRRLARPHRRDRAASTARTSSRTATREGLGAALRTGLEHARDQGYAAAVYLDGDGEYDPRRARARCSSRWPAGAPTTCSARASSATATG